MTHCIRDFIIDLDTPFIDKIFYSISNPAAQVAQMKQLTQNFRTGELTLADVPPPKWIKGNLLVQNLFSLISTGTERATVAIAQSSMLDKARKHPDLVRQVLDNVKKEGLPATIKKTQARLDSPKALGYSSCGLVVESRDYNGAFSVGDQVACVEPAQL